MLTDNHLAQQTLITSRKSNVLIVTCQHYKWFRSSLCTHTHTHCRQFDSLFVADLASVVSNPHYCQVCYRSDFTAGKTQIFDNTQEKCSLIVVPFLLHWGWLYPKPSYPNLISSMVIIPQTTLQFQVVMHFRPLYHRISKIGTKFCNNRTDASKSPLQISQSLSLKLYTKSWILSVEHGLITALSSFTIAAKGESGWPVICP